ncbi:MAG: anti-sigma factor [Chitinophagales bacterium]
MNTQNYISSGILELYAMDALTQAEKQEVEVMLQKHESIKLELLQIQDALNSYALLHALAPPANSLKNDSSSLKSKSSPLKQINPSISSQIRKFQFLAAAAMILFLLSAILNWTYFLQLKEANSEIVLLQQEKNLIADGFEGMKAQYNTANTELDILQNPNNRIVKMTGIEKHPESLAYVYWNVESQEVYVKIEELPIPPTEKQYQLWALKDGKPIDVGVFDVKTGLLKVKNIEAADAFAVTLESKGGSSTPTLEEMYVVGEVKLI